MNVRFFDNRRVRQLLTICFLTGALSCMFPPELPLFQWWAGHAIFVAVGYLLLGLFFLAINNIRLMFVCLGCSAAICFFKNETEGRMIINDPLEKLERSYETPARRDSFFLKPTLPHESSKTGK